MISRQLVLDAIFLQLALQDAFSEIGCVHKYVRKGTRVFFSVPFDSSHYDSASGLVWVTIHRQRLPRRFSISRLIELGLDKLVSRYFGRDVVITDKNDCLVVIGMSTRSKSVEECRVGSPDK